MSRAGVRPALRDLNDRDPRQDLQHGPVALLHHIQLPKQEREHCPSSAATGSHICEPDSTVRPLPGLT